MQPVVNKAVDWDAVMDKQSASLAVAKEATASSSSAVVEVVQHVFTQVPLEEQRNPFPNGLLFHIKKESKYFEKSLMYFFKTNSTWQQFLALKMERIDLKQWGTLMNQLTL